MAVYPFPARKVYEYHFFVNTQPIDFLTIKFLAGIAAPRWTWLLQHIRRATVADQQKALDWLKQKFGDLS